MASDEILAPCCVAARRVGTSPAAPSWLGMLLISPNSVMHVTRGVTLLPRTEE